MGCMASCLKKRYKIDQPKKLYYHHYDPNLLTTYAQPVTYYYIDREASTIGQAS